MPTSTVNGFEMSYVERGAGTPLVLLHGFPLDARVWAAQVEGLSARCRVVAPDLRGFGGSRSDAGFTTESLADDVHALLGAIGALPCVLGGLSMGGYVALAYAAKYPADLRGLILMDTKAEADAPEAKAARTKMAELALKRGSEPVADLMMPRMFHPDAPAALAAELRGIMFDCPPATIFRAQHAMRDRPDRSGELATIRTPTLLIYGEADVITPPAVGEATAARIPGSRLVVIPGAGHMPLMEKPGEVNGAIGEWLAVVG